MFIESNRHGKTLKLNSLCKVLKQGEKSADAPVFVLPLQREGVDFTSLSWMLIATTDKKTETGSGLLPVSIVEGMLHIKWEVTENFTAVATQCMDLTLTGINGSGEVVVKFEGDVPIEVSKAKVGQFSPPPWVIDYAILQAIEAAQRAEDAAMQAKQIVDDGTAKINAVVASGTKTIEQILQYGYQQISTILEQGMLIADPTTGMRSPVQTVVQNLFALHTTGAITPEAFDALELTPEVFDAYEIDPLDFDTNAKNILI